MSDKQNNQSENDSNLSRRQFVQSTAAAVGALAAPAVLTSRTHAQATSSDAGDVLRLGLIGCGGRGTSAVSNAIESSPNVKIVALADLSESKLSACRSSLRSAWEERGNYAVTDDNCFVGMDCYKQVCAHPDVDIVLHVTPPGLRFLTLREAIENGKHSFVEKPVCVDPFTYRHVVESGDLADQKGLAIVSGTQYRRENSYRAAIERLQDGIIGDVQCAFAYYCGGPLWLREEAKQFGIDTTDYQMRNWLYFNWLSGDHITEQAIHNIDAINWGLGGVPEKAFGNGGRIQRTDPAYGNVYDHFSIDYDYPGGTRVSFKCRQLGGAQGRTTNRFIGSKGTMDIRPGVGSTATVVRDLDGKPVWHNNGRKGNNAPYVEEHRALIASIRDGEPIQEILEVANSSMTSIIGREAAYSGQEVTFDWAIKQSKQNLIPEVIEPGQNQVAPVPVPGKYRLS